MENTLMTINKWKSTSYTKKDYRKDKSNYRSIIILSNVSNVSMRFSQGLHDALLSLVETMVLARDKKQVCGAILTDLLKAFDFVSHDLVIAKLNAYGFYRNALKVIHDCLSGRSQKLKLFFRYDTWCSPRINVRICFFQHKFV